MVDYSMIIPEVTLCEKAFRSYQNQHLVSSKCYCPSILYLNDLTFISYRVMQSSSIVGLLSAVTLAVLASHPQLTNGLAVMSIDLGSEWIKVAVVKPGIPMEIVLNK